jgi:hypothetical protein
LALNIPALRITDGITTDTAAILPYLSLVPHPQFLVTIAVN